MQRCWPRAPHFGSVSVISSFLLHDIPRHDTHLFEVREAFKRTLLVRFRAYISAYIAKIGQNQWGKLNYQHLTFVRLPEIAQKTACDYGLDTSFAVRVVFKIARFSHGITCILNGNGLQGPIFCSVFVFFSFFFRLMKDVVSLGG